MKIALCLREMSKIMDIVTCTPHKLPLKTLNWGKISPAIGHARESLARFDESVKKASAKSLKQLEEEECIHSLRNADPKKISYVKEGLKGAVEWAAARPLNISFLCYVHAIVKQDGSQPKEIGRLRKKQNWIGPEGAPVEEAYFFPPKPEKVRPLMQELFRYLKKKGEEPLVHLAIFFAQLLVIHPFMDGNGRVARIFTPIWLWKQGLISKPALFLSTYLERTRLQYFRKLFYISEKDAWEDWILYFLKGVAEQADHSRKIIHSCN